jgi:Flp pilus assembly protein TadD
VLAVSDDVAVSFFSTPPVTHPAFPVEETATADAASERRRRLRSDTAVARRRDFARYVTGAVAVCVMICAAAAVRAATVSRADRDEASLQLTHATHATQSGVAHKESAVAAPPPAAEVIAPATGPATETAPAPANAPPTEPAAGTSAETPAAEARAEAHDQAPTETATGTAPPSAQPSGDAVDARESKKLAQRALDRGDATKAIEAAKQSVEGDPSDAETWLILGGAYLARGAAHDARESFASCARVATRGPRSECRALLR